MTEQTNPIDWLVNQINEDCLNSTFVRPEIRIEAQRMFKEAVNNAHLEGFKEATKEYTQLFQFTLKPRQ